MDLLEDNNIYIEITVTEHCNCNCIYCFEGNNRSKPISNKVEEEKQLKLLVDLCERFDAVKHKWLSLSFWGGEPFANAQYMYKIINSTCKYPFVRYHCFSNGTLVNQYEDFIKQPFISSISDRMYILLSYDGEPHNKIKRGYSHENIIKSAKLLKSVGIGVTFKATLSYDMIKYLPEIWKSYEELYYKFEGEDVRYFPTLDSNVTCPEYFDDWKEALIKVAKLEYKFKLKTGHNLFEQFSSEGKKCACRLKNSFFMHLDGNMYVCHGAPYVDNKNVIFGNTSSIVNLDDVLAKCNVDSDSLTDYCERCPATYCAVCHITTLKNDDKDIVKAWKFNRANDKSKCEFYQYFGYISKLLKYAIYLQYDKNAKSI